MLGIKTFCPRNVGANKCFRIYSDVLRFGLAAISKSYVTRCAPLLAERKGKFNNGTGLSFGEREQPAPSTPRILGAAETFSGRGRFCLTDTSQG